MRTGFMLPVIFLLAALLAAPAAGGEAGFPLSLGGQSLTLDTQTRRADVEAALGRAFPKEQPSVLAPERIQYDVVFVAGQGPASLAFDFDAKGRLTGVVLDAMAKEQNPPAARLAAWLAAEAGQGVKDKGDRVWTWAGFRFRLTETKNAGEDSAYRLAVERQGR